MQSIETDDILFTVLNGSAALKAELKGGIYTMGERPDGSTAEDIVVNNLNLTHEIPQSGTSNVNIHVPDEKVKISGKEQYKTARERLRLLTGLVLAALKAANIEGLTFWVSNETTIREEAIKQSYNNLRVEWNIQRTN